MRNFFPSNSPVIFDKMFGKGARQFQADPSANLTGCCCNCKSVTCKGCIDTHVITPDAGCCQTKNTGLIFEYERPASYGDGMLCAPDCQKKICCVTGKDSASNVRFYYNYIGQYFTIDYGAIGKDTSVWPYNGRPRLCSYCDPTSSDINRRDFFPYANETCIDHFTNVQLDRRIDDKYPDPPPYAQDTRNYPCSNNDQAGPIIPEISLFKGCQCMGDGVLADPDDFKKRLSRYRKRQMERDPYYRWLLDIMCYDNGNIIASPFYEYTYQEGIPGKYARNYAGTLYDHLIGVVHCEHWYEIARCPDNPEHNDGEVLGSWIVDADGNPSGANTSLLAPRFWVYACSGAPLFDFELEEAYKKSVNGQPLFQQEDISILERNLAQRTTPPQKLMDKLASLGYFDVGDWRNEALSEIRVLKGLTYTREAYGGNPLGDPDFGACCIPAGTATPAQCSQLPREECGLIPNSSFIAQTQCTSEVCENCSGFKPGNGQNRYLGPVRKRLWIPSIEGGVGYAGITAPAWLNPKKARKNKRDDLMLVPDIARNEIDISQDDTLTNLQLPDDLIKDPWGGSYPAEPLGSEEPSDEYKDFVKWRESQWLYMHARPGGWNYVCSAYNTGKNITNEDMLRIPNLPRQVSAVGSALGGCLDGARGFPRRSRRYSGGGCPDVDCGEAILGLPPFPVVGCNEPGCGAGFGIACIESAWCDKYPEDKGGITPCEGLAIDSNCDGLRIVHYTTKYVDQGPDLERYATCGGTINSYLYKVNIDAGNYGDFCPHQCRPLEIPKRLADAVPSLISNRSAHADICRNHYNHKNLEGDPAQKPYLGSICPGLYCKENPIINNYENYVDTFAVLDSGCCNFKTNGDPAELDGNRSSSHRASNRTRCPLVAGPPCFGPNCEFYDGRFVGTINDWNPKGCCWKCSGPPANQPLEFAGIKTYMECLQINSDDQGNWDGRGFLYIPDQLNRATQCSLPTVGECACGTNNPRWEFGNTVCSDTETEGDTEV